MRKSRLVTYVVVGVVSAVVLAGGISYFALSYYPRLRLQRLLKSVTDEYVRDHVCPMTDEIAARAHAGLPLDPAILKERRITMIEVGTPDPDSPYPTCITKVVYRDDNPVYEFRGFITVLPNARRAGMSIPRDLDSPILVLRVNYSYDSDGYVAVHVAVDRPCTSAERTPYTD